MLASFNALGDSVSLRCAEHNTREEICTPNSVDKKAIGWWCSGCSSFHAVVFRVDLFASFELIEANKVYLR